MPADAGTSFEAKFAQLAESSINEKLPSLMQYRVGFQAIDKSDDETQSVGIAAFVVHGIWLYLPVFFMSGKIKMPVLYVVQLDLFVPPMDNWVSALVQRGSDTLGWVRERWSPGELPGARAGDVQVYMPYMGGGGAKYASANEVQQDPSTGRMVTGHLHQLATALNQDNGGIITGDQLIKLASHYADADLVVPSLLPSLAPADNPMFPPAVAQRLLAKFANLLVGSPDFANALFTFYTPAQIHKLAHEGLQQAPESVKAPSPLRFYTNHKQASELSSAEQGIFARNGIFIRDDRTNFSKIFRDQVDTSVVSNPTMPGVYDVLMKDGSWKPFVVLFPDALDGVDAHFRTKEQNVGRKVAMIDPQEPQDYLEVYSKDIFCRPATDSKQVPKTGPRGGKMATLQNLIDIGPYKRILLVQDALHCLTTTLVSNQLGPDGKMTALAECLPDRPRTLGNGTSATTLLEFSGEDGDLKTVQGRIFVPKGCKVFVCRPQNLGRGGLCPPIAVGVPVTKPVSESQDKAEQKEAEKPDYQFGALGDIQIMLHKQAGLRHRRLFVDGGLTKLAADGKETGLLPRKEMLELLTQQHGIFAGQAVQMLKSAEQAKDHCLGFYIKYAAPYDVAAYYPGPVPFMGGPGASNPEAVRYEDQKVTPNPLTTSMASDGSAVNPQKVIERASKAAETGIKEVFDVEVLKSLIQAADISELRKEYLADMIRGMDKIGRMLIMYYWHHDDFEERYGKSSLTQLESSLSDVFATMGDLILFLKEKTAKSPEVSAGLLGMLSEDVATTQMSRQG